MTEHNRGSVGTPSQEEEQQAPRSPENAPADEWGFAPPDAPAEQHAPPSPADKLLVSGPADPPGGFDHPRPPRPAFVPHNQEQGGVPPYGWPQQHPAPPPARTPFGGPPPGPGGPPIGHGAPPTGFGGPGNGPNWAPAPSPPAPPRGGPGLGVLALVALVVALVAGAVGAGVGVIATGGNDTGSGGSVDLGGTSSAPGNKSRPAGTVAGVAQRLLPSVVMIKVQGGNGESGAGTGFIVRDGYIITNNHVVAPAAGGSLQVVFNDQKTTTATVVGRDPSSDVAVLKPATTNRLPALQLGNSDDIAVGDSVIAIGSPLGLQGSVTTGIISSVNRAVPTNGEGGDSSVLNAIQTDAAINPGNSGGPLVDSQGRVIGMNTAIATLGGGGGFGGGQSQGGSIGLGFAIPINQAKRVAEQIINSGKASHARIGATMDLQYQGTGVRIAQSAQEGQQPLVKGGPADRAGLKPGDIITAFDGKPVAGPTDLLAMIRSRAPGDKVKISYKRGSDERTVDITLGEAN
ncbi:S1C family serine protease [Actinomadura sp. HBU206391]|uniref:S1C family serine protease n=1 Tax=Actinomadura sp. HBU206391 TaxID=2731692 RepID=UPI00165097F5|nr:trypsin-like peptidase domain-containing protein [Actinomadura sp. HBU206391]MBC6463493.1 trypsin-like peptidase domain-containing protein [Actinomadura sp. HBU206391]